jgi:putative DNA primase/helicase
MLTLEQQIALGLATATGFSTAGFSENYEPPEALRGPRFPLTDAGNSLRFSEDHDGELIYVPGLGWHFWDGKRWARDDAAAWRAAKETARRIRFEAAAIEDSDVTTRVFSHALRSESKPRLDAMIELASKGEITDMGLVVPVEKIDANPFALNCANGTVSLKTGELHPHAKDRYITHLVDVEYDAEAKAPLWDQTVAALFEGDLGYMAWVQRAVGYSATGTPNPEKCFFLPYGAGNNGKTVFTETIKRVLGGLAQVAASDTFISSRGSSIQNDLASLRGARFVLVPETEDGDKLARQVIKRVTGGNTIRARFMYRDWFSYTPQFTIWIETNHLPQVPISDRAAWDRIKVVPFRRTFTRKEQNKRLREQLGGELPGILAWVVRGAVAWYRDGLGELPLAVATATFDYRASQDTIGRFLEDETEDDLEGNVIQTALRDSYRKWCLAEGLVPVSPRALYEALEERGYRKAERNVGRTFEGLKLSGTG